MVRDRPIDGCCEQENVCENDLCLITRESDR